MPAYLLVVGGTTIQTHEVTSSRLSFWNWEWILVSCMRAWKLSDFYSQLIIRFMWGRSQTSLNSTWDMTIQVLKWAKFLSTFALENDFVSYVLWQWMRVSVSETHCINTCECLALTVLHEWAEYFYETWVSDCTMHDCNFFPYWHTISLYKAFIT